MTSPKDNLLDAVGLSKKCCKAPIQAELLYATKENFLGRPVDGYHANAMSVCLLTPKAAKALCNVQNDLHKEGLGLYVYDAFRPLRAVRDFKKWSEEEPTAYELERKAVQYPDIDKKDFDEMGYVAMEVSRHCFGFAVDLTLIDLESNELLDMGAPFDYFGRVAHAVATREEVGEPAYSNRKKLEAAMSAQGFSVYDQEYWHFDYHIHEVDDPMDMDIDQSCIGLNA